MRISDSVSKDIYSTCETLTHFWKQCSHSIFVIICTCSSQPVLIVQLICALVRVFGLSRHLSNWIICCYSKMNKKCTKCCPEHPIDLGFIIFPGIDHESSLPDVDVPGKHQAFIRSGFHHSVERHAIERRVKNNNKNRTIIVLQLRPVPQNLYSGQVQNVSLLRVLFCNEPVLSINLILWNGWHEAETT